MKRLLQLVVCSGLFWSVNGFGITAPELLASPWQRQRDLAAAVLQNSYTLPPRSTWDALMNSLKPGTKEPEVQRLLRLVNAVPREGSLRNRYFQSYRLDDLWVLSCSFTNSAHEGSEPLLHEVNLEQDLKDVWVPPPSDYTGPWTTYWANGQPSHRIECQNGKYEGTVTTFYPKGSTNEVVSYHNGVLNGAETGYYESGAIRYRGQYAAGQQVGRWVWYKENGAVESTKDFSSGGK